MSKKKTPDDRVLELVKGALQEHEGEDPIVSASLRTLELLENLRFEGLEKEAKIKKLRELKDRCDDLMGRYGEVYKKKKEKMQVVVGCVTLGMGALGALLGYLKLSDLRIVESIAAQVARFIAKILEEPRLYSEHLVGALSKCVGALIGGLASLYVSNKIAGGVYEGVANPEDYKSLQQNIEKLKNAVNTALVNELDS